MHEMITEHLDDVWRATGARVRLSETSMSQPRAFSVEIQGSLIGVYRAHCMLIRMHHEVASFEERMTSMFRGQAPDAASAHKVSCDVHARVAQQEETSASKSCDEEARDASQLAVPIAPPLRVTFVPPPPPPPPPPPHAEPKVEPASLLRPKAAVVAPEAQSKAAVAARSMGPIEAIHRGGSKFIMDSRGMLHTRRS